MCSINFSFVKIFLKNYLVTMTTTLNTSCSENTMVLSEGEGFCMHVFSSSYDRRFLLAMR